MSLRGIKGPSYRFIHGSNKEILSMQKEARDSPFGLSHDIFPKLQPHIHYWTKLYGNNFLQWDGSKPQLVITETELVKEILSERDGAYSKEKIKSFTKKLLGDGLVVSEGEKWTKVRKLANYAFHAESLKRMIPAMIDGVEAMLERWKCQEGKEVEVSEEFRLLTSEVISRTAFGSSYLEGKNIFEMLRRLTLLASRNLYNQSFPVISLFRTHDQIESEKLENGVHRLIVELIKKQEEKIVNWEEESCGNDFLGLLVKAHHDANESLKISVDGVVDECKTFYLAGQETTTSLLAWTVFLLSVHTDWQEEARKEVLGLFGRQNPNPDDLAKLKTMGLIINESLRLYPPVISMIREVRFGKKLNIPANISLFISNLAIHHDPQIWGENVHLFKPDRFSEGVAKATNNNIAAFIPFGLGHRNCVGLNFGIAEAKIALTMILQRYALTLSPAYVHSPVQVLTNQPQYGVQVILHPF
ncbi:cytochrome P450 CYP749A22-like isoform X2 [Humulus lupulus]|uniref:cytochrome P450 CYP749A22-like isoform X2 n=1 Tax=Humulus lupulus TaxID=3486 RepID=UPI002B41716E|nr:cytochrome P450 CYP749A22-like isoform X2 [Humulus lupulus]